MHLSAVAFHYAFRDHVEQDQPAWPLRNSQTLKSNEDIKTALFKIFPMTLPPMSMANGAQSPQPYVMPEPLPVALHKGYIPTTGYPTKLWPYWILDEKSLLVRNTTQPDENSGVKLN
jgi:hypothetical protein